MITANVVFEGGHDHTAASMTTGQFRELPLEPTAIRRSGLLVQRDPENHTYYEEKTFDAEEKTVEARSTWYNRFSRNATSVVANATNLLIDSVKRRQRHAPHVEMGMTVGPGEPIPGMDVVLDILPEAEPASDIVVPCALSVDVTLCVDNGFNQGDQVYYHSKRSERGVRGDGVLFLRDPPFYAPDGEVVSVDIEEKYDDPIPPVVERLIEPEVPICAICLGPLGRSIIIPGCGLPASPHAFCLPCYRAGERLHPLAPFPCPLCRSVAGIEPLATRAMAENIIWPVQEPEDFDGPDMDEVVAGWDRAHRDAVEDASRMLADRAAGVMAVGSVLPRQFIGPLNQDGDRAWRNFLEADARDRLVVPAPVVLLPVVNGQNETLFSEMEGDNLTTMGHVTSRVYAFHLEEHFNYYLLPQVYYQSFGILTRAYVSQYEFAPPEPGFDVQDDNVYVRLPVALVRALETYMVGQRHSVEVWQVLQEHCKQLLRDFRDPPGAIVSMTLEYFQFYAPLYAFLMHDRRAMHERHILVTGEYWRSGSWGRFCLKVQSVPRLAYRVCKWVSLLLFLLMLVVLVSKFGVMGGLSEGGGWLLQGLSDVIEWLLPGIIAWLTHA